MGKHKKIKDEKVREHFDNELPFENIAGSLVGWLNPSHVPRGNLDDREASRLRIDFDTKGIRYIVLSFGTPIAWVNGEGMTYRIEQNLTDASEAHKKIIK